MVQNMNLVVLLEASEEACWMEEHASREPSEEPNVMCCYSVSLHALLYMELYRYTL